MKTFGGILLFFRWVLFGAVLLFCFGGDDSPSLLTAPNLIGGQSPSQIFDQESHEKITSGSLYRRKEPSLPTTVVRMERWTDRLSGEIFLSLVRRRYVLL